MIGAIASISVAVWVLRRTLREDARKAAEDRDEQQRRFSEQSAIQREALAAQLRAMDEQREVLVAQVEAQRESASLQVQAQRELAERQLAEQRAALESQVARENRHLQEQQEEDKRTRQEESMAQAVRDVTALLTQWLTLVYESVVPRPDLQDGPVDRARERAAFLKFSSRLVPQGSTISANLLGRFPNLWYSAGALFVAYHAACCIFDLNRTVTQYYLTWKNLPDDAAPPSDLPQGLTIWKIRAEVVEYVDSAVRLLPLFVHKPDLNVPDGGMPPEEVRAFFREYLPQGYRGDELHEILTEFLARDTAAPHVK